MLAGLGRLKVTPVEAPPVAGVTLGEERHPNIFSNAGPWCSDGATEKRK